LVFSIKKRNFALIKLQKHDLFALTILQKQSVFALKTLQNVHKKINRQRLARMEQGKEA